jgi:ribosomal protein S12 methylthiotransferase accessory factor
VGCHIIALDGDCCGIVQETLESLGVGVSDNAAFQLVVARDYLDRRLGAIEDRCRRESTPWMLVRPHGRCQWIGPLFTVGSAGCWYCLARWLTINGWSAASVVADLPALTRTTLGLAALEAGKWLLTGRNETVDGRLREFDTGALAFAEHRLLPWTGCPYCRALMPEQGAGLRATVSALTGVMARLERVREWPGLAVFTAEGSQRVGFDRTGSGYLCRPQRTFGVAESSTGAEEACLAEGVERYSVRYQGDQPVVMASYRQLGARAVDPALLALASEAQLAAPAEDDDPAMPVRVPPGADSEIGWVEAVSLVSGERRYVPAGHVYLGYDAGRFSTDTNGCAAGVTADSATLAALLELIERDAVALWWYNRAPRPAVDLAALSSRRIDAVLAAARESGRQVAVLDLTADFRIPVCAAVAAGESSGIALGFAAHPDPERCAWKALAEMSAGMAMLENPRSARRQWLGEARVQEFPHLVPCGPKVCWGPQPPDETGSMVKTLVQRAHAIGLDVLAMDLTRAELGVPVVRVVAPGLRPLARRLAPGRLYDVPAALGWVPHRLSEPEMNPMRFAL